jgi:hypothetical protein
MSPFRLALLLTAGGAAAAIAAAGPLPVRGLHVSAPKPDEIPLTVRFIREALPKEGVNLLVMEFNYRYKFSKHPEVAEPDALSRDDVRQIAEACRDAGVRLIPQINLLGHQSWAKNTFALLRAHPEFDETPNLYPSNEGIYCRSYCPLHPGIHKIIYDLIDELVEACQSDAFHAGMDEVFLLGEDACPRCRGKNKAELLAGEVRAVHDHLATSKRELWIWSDRLLDGDTTGIGKWEASQVKTAPALRMIPTDVVLCDWHYDVPHPTAAYFAIEGFRVVSSPWRRTSVAVRQLDFMRDARRYSSPLVAARMLGMLQTTWVDFGRFAKAYFAANNENPQESDRQVIESLACFRELFRELRRDP